jgi:uncharacterized protein (TIGR02996 family)
MRRFEFKDGKSNKFWEIQLEGDSFTVRYGKIGTDGQLQTKSFASEAKAEAEAEKLIKSKTKKGYVEVSAKPSGEAKAAPKTQRKPSRNPDLEAAIIANPDDVDAWQVYFDWLQTQGDPWGERGNLALARDKAKGAAKAKLTKQIEAFEQEHGEALYGEALLSLRSADDFDQVATLEYRHGLIWKVTAKAPEYDWDGTSPVATLAAVAKSSSARLIHAINIGLVSHDPPDVQAGLDAIWDGGELPSLHTLFIGDFEYPEDTEISWIEDGIDASVVLKNAPKLRSLHVRGSYIGLGKIEHATLEHLFIETGGLPEDTVKSVGKCKLPALTSLEVWFGREDYGASGNIKQLAPLFKGAGVPKLEHLGLKNCDWQDDIAVALTKSDLLAQLKTVDLSMGTLHGDGAEAIIANPAKYTHLEKLDLSDNYLSEDQVARLKKALGKIVEIGRQRQPYDRGGDLRYYASVGE